jgi:uncharacterized protein YjiS (DUF1127 family)
MITPLERQLMRHVTGPAPVGAELTMPYRPQPPRYPSGGGRRVLAALGRLWRAFAAMQEARATARALAVLDDRALHDIGVDRGAIPAVARQVASAHLAVAGLAWTSSPVGPASNDNPRHRAA